jgi:hypothetical protein
MSYLCKNQKPMQITTKEEKYCFFVDKFCARQHLPKHFIVYMHCLKEPENLFIEAGKRYGEKNFFQIQPATNSAASLWQQFPLRR